MTHMEDGVEVHLRAGESESLIFRAEGLGNRVVGGMIVAAFIGGLRGLTTADRDLLCGRAKPQAADGVGAVRAMRPNLAWTGRPGRNRARRP